SPHFPFQRSAGPPALHSFPTRRSSDLATGLLGLAWLRTGIRPAKRAWRPALMAPQNAAAIRTGSRASASAVFTRTASAPISIQRSEEHTSELQSLAYLVCRLLLEKKKL